MSSSSDRCKVGVLLLHGFTGSPAEVEPLRAFLAEHTDWKIAVPTLPGHGEGGDLRGCTAESWLLEAEMALRLLSRTCESVHVIGFSMGGVIAMHLALRYEVASLVLLSAAAKYISPRQMLRDVQGALKDAARGELTANPLYRTYRSKFSNTPLSATREFMRLVSLVRPHVGLVSVPVFIVQGKKDGLVPYRTAAYLQNLLGSESLRFYASENGKHMICYSDDAPIWFREVLDFLKGTSE